jgi:hypothetical protein
MIGKAEHPRSEVWAKVIGTIIATMVYLTLAYTMIHAVLLNS